MLKPWRRAIAAALLALQSVVALLPAMEQRGEVRLDTHMEAPGNEHLPAHNDATCAVCAVRALWGAVPQQAAPLFPPASIGRADIVFAAVAPTVGVAPDNHPRAPPVEG